MHSAQGSVSADESGARARTACRARNTVACSRPIAAADAPNGSVPAVSPRLFPACESAFKIDARLLEVAPGGGTSRGTGGNARRSPTTTRPGRDRCCHPQAPAPRSPPSACALMDTRLSGGNCEPGRISSFFFSFSPFFFLSSALWRERKKRKKEDSASSAPEIPDVKSQVVPRSATRFPSPAPPGRSSKGCTGQFPCPPEKLPVQRRAERPAGPAPTTTIAGVPCPASAAGKSPRRGEPSLALGGECAAAWRRARSRWECRPVSPPQLA